VTLVAAIRHIRFNPTVPGKPPLETRRHDAERDCDSSFDLDCARVRIQSGCIIACLQWQTKGPAR